MRNFEHSRITRLTAEEYERQARILLPLRQRHMGHLLMSGVMDSLLFESARKGRPGPAVNEGTSVAPIRSAWAYIDPQTKGRLCTELTSRPRSDSQVLMINRIDVVHAGTLKITEHYLYELGMVSPDGTEIFTAAGVSDEQAEVVNECIGELVEARMSHRLTMLDPHTLEEAWSITDAPAGWRPLDWN